MTPYQVALFAHIAGAMALVVGLALRRRPVIGGAGLVVLASGLFLASQGWGFQPWSALGLVSLVALGAGGARLPATAPTTGALLGLATGVVWLMATKPGWLGGLAALAVATLAGWALGRYAGARRERSVV